MLRFLCKLLLRHFKIEYLHISWWRHINWRKLSKCYLWSSNLPRWNIPHYWMDKNHYFIDCCISWCKFNGSLVCNGLFFIFIWHRRFYLFVSRICLFKFSSLFLCLTHSIHLANGWNNLLLGVIFYLSSPIFDFQIL